MAGITILGASLAIWGMILWFVCHQYQQRVEKYLQRVELYLLLKARQEGDRLPFPRFADMTPPPPPARKVGSMPRNIEGWRLQ